MKKKGNKNTKKVENTKEKETENTKKKELEIENTKKENGEKVNFDRNAMTKVAAGVGLSAAIVAHVLNKAQTKKDLQQTIINLFFSNKIEYSGASPEIIIIHNVIYNIIPTKTIQTIKSFKHPINVKSLCRALVVILEHPITDEYLVLKTLDNVFECFPDQTIDIFPFLEKKGTDESDIGLVYLVQNFFSWQRVCQKKNIPFLLPNETKETLKRLNLPIKNFCKDERLKNSLTDSFQKVLECMDNKTRIENCPILKELEPRKKDLMIYLEVYLNNIALYNYLKSNGLFLDQHFADVFLNQGDWEKYFAMFCRQILSCSPIHKPKDIEHLFQYFKGKYNIIFSMEYFGIPGAKNYKFFDNLSSLSNMTFKIKNSLIQLENFINDISIQKKLDIDNIFNFKLIDTNVYLSDIISKVVFSNKMTPIPDLIPLTHIQGHNSNSNTIPNSNSNTIPNSNSNTIKPIPIKDISNSNSNTITPIQLSDHTHSSDSYTSSISHSSYTSSDYDDVYYDVDESK